MREQEVRGLQEAYMQVYELDEGKKKFPTDKVNNQAVKHEKDYLKNPNSSGSSLFKSRKMRAIKSTVDAGSDPRKTIHGQDLRKLGTKNEELDLYDIILSHLIDEGYAETPEAAERIMVNMSEEWRESIVETRMDPRGRPASGPMNVYANPKGKPSQARLDAIKSYEDEQRKKTPEQRKKELDDYRERQMNNK